MSRLWGTLKEPKVLSFLMVLIYLCVGVMGVHVLLAYHAILGLVAGIFLCFGCLIGLPSAWVGATWSEYSGALLSTIGLGAMGLLRIKLFVNSEPSAVYAILVYVILALFFLSRSIAVHPETGGWVSEDERLRQKALKYKDLINRS